MANFRTSIGFNDSGAAIDGYDVYSNRVDGVDTIAAADVNSLASSVTTVQKSLADGYAITTIFPRSDSSGLTWQDGQALVYSSATNTMINGASGDSSFKVQSITTPSAVLKSGFIILDDGRELRLATDTTINLNTVLGSTPANATAYYLYIDLTTLPSASFVSGRKVFAIAQANFFLSITTPDSINSLARYVPIGEVLTATSGNSWSGAGSSFSTLATRRHDRTSVAASPVVYTTTGLTSATTSVAHNANVPVANQRWSAIVTRTSDGYQLQLDNNYIVKMTTNTLFTDFTFLASGDTVALSLENLSVTAQTVPTKSYDSGVVAANSLTFPISHGLGSVPTAVVLQHQIASGEFENLNPSNFISTTNTQIKDDANWTSVLGSDNVRIVLSLSTDANAIALTSLGSDLLPSADNTFSLGSSTLRWKTLNVGPSSLIVRNDITDTQKLSIEYTTSDAYFHTDSTSGMRWKSGTTDTGSLSTAGAWTFGPSNGTVQDTVHKVQSQRSAYMEIAAANTFDSYLRWSVGGTVNSYIRSSSANVMEFLNGSASSVGQISAGVWTLGASAATGTTLHTVNGRITSTFNSKTRAHLSTDQSVTTATLARVTFDTRDFDLNSEVDITTNKGRFTPTKAGYYLVSAHIRIKTSITSTSNFIGLYKNTGTRAALYNHNGFTTSQQNFLLTDIIFLNGSTDFIEIFYNNAEAGTATIDSNGNDSGTSYISITQLV